MPIKPIEGFWVHDEETNTDGVATISIGAIDGVIQEDIAPAVETWLDAHPEATTTVEDGAIVTDKIADGAVTEEKVEVAFLPFISNDYVTPEMYGAKGDGTTDDTAALQRMFDTGKMVWFPIGSKTYAVNDTLAYEGSRIIGNSAIKSISPTINVLYCTAENIYIEGLQIDCNGKSARGIYCYCYNGDTCIVDGTTVKNTDNSGIENAVSCSGMYLSHYTTVSARHNKVYNINRTNTSPGVISSVGISVTTTGTAEVCYNTIDTVKCSNETTDCDGIFVSTTGTNAITNTAEIIGNRITDTTGRFVKTQTKRAVIRNNYCALVNSASNLFHKAFDFQYGDGIADNNYVDYGFKTSGSAMFVHADYVQNPKRNIAITRNHIKNVSGMRALFKTGGGTIDGKVTVSGNFLEKVETLSYFTYIFDILHSSNHVDLIYKDNNVGYYRLFKVDTSNTDYTSFFLIVEGNNSETYTNNAIFDAALSINNLVLRDNLNMVSQITNATMNYTDMKVFALEHTSPSLISNLPSTIDSTGRVYLESVNRRYCQYYESAHGTSKIIEKTY